MEYSKMEKEKLVEEAIRLEAQVKLLEKTNKKQEEKLAKQEEEFNRFEQETKIAIDKAKEQVESMIKTKDEAVANEHKLRNELNRANDTIIQKTQENQALIQDLNVLATMFDESYKNHEDQITFIGAALRSFQTSYKVLKEKLDIFNGVGKEKKEGEPKK